MKKIGENAKGALRADLVVVTERTRIVTSAFLAWGT